MHQKTRQLAQALPVIAFDIARYLVLILTAVCLSGPTNAQISGTVEVLTNRSDLAENGNFRRWTREFERLYPGVDIKVVALPNYDESVAPLFAERRYGDVVVVPNELPKEAYPKYFEPLNDMGLSDRVYFSDAWAYQGREYAYTQGVSAEGVIYNKTLLRALGYQHPPKTLSELYAMSEAIKSAGKTAVALNVGAKWTLQQWDKLVITISEDEKFYRNMASDISPFEMNKPYAKSFEIAYNLFTRGFSEEDFIVNQWEQSKVAFADSQIAMFFMGSWLIPQLIGSGIPSRDVGFAPMPVDDSGSLKALLNVDRGLAVSRYSQNKVAAKKYIEFLLTQSNFADVSGYIPTIKSRESGIAQLKEYMGYKPKIIMSAAVDNQFLRLANRAGMDFLEGGYVRDVLISSSFEGSMKYWNERWRQAIAVSRE